MRAESELFIIVTELNVWDPFFGFFEVFINSQGVFGEFVGFNGSIFHTNGD